MPGDEHQALILAARTMIEREPAYNQVTARLLLASLGREVLGRPVTPDEFATVTPEYLLVGLDAVWHSANH